MIKLNSDRIILRKLQLEDAEILFSYRSDPEISRYQFWQPETLKDALSFIQNKVADKINIPGTWFQFAIVKSVNNEVIGDCGIHFLENDNYTVEIGITLKRDVQGLGFAAEVLKTLFNYIFYDLNKHRIFASVDPRNLSCIRLLERMKMRKEAHFIESIWFNNNWIDDVVFAILKREWPDPGN